MSKYDFFWKTMKLCDWEYEGNDELVLRPVITYLSSREDQDIFAFDDMMSELLYAIDTQKLAKQCQKVDGLMSDDSFLYSRCIALINGPGYYERAKAGKCKEMWTMEFEALLSVPHEAWAVKHKKEASQYPHIPPVSYETGSNVDGWK